MRDSTIALRLLCIDDDAEFVEVLSRHLSSRGIAVLHAFDAIQGYRMAITEHPDVIITDYCMPYRFGTHLLRQLRETPGLMQIPVIVVSGRDIHGNPSHEDDQRQAQLLQELGAQNVLRKPLNWQALYDAIEACAASRKVQAADDEPVAREANPVARGMKTLLVVDDDDQARHAIEKRLRRSGFHVITAGSGHQAFTLADRHCPDAITLDVRLPDMDGLEVAQWLHDHPRTSSIPIIFLAGKVDRHFREASRAVGGKYFIRKPFDPELLVKAVNDVAGDTAQVPPATCCT
jgi:CheY-like chemotaxis protein